MRNHTKKNIIITSDEETRLIKSLEGKTDADSLRLKRFINLPDLSRTPGSPLYELMERIYKIPTLGELDTIQIPEIVRADISFDLFNFPTDHPARSKSDTYYLDDDHILRTHTTVMWYYYLNDEDIKKRIAEGLDVGAICHGKVYRKDEIDRNHMNVFHQIDGWYLCPKSQKVITIEDLKEILVEVAQSVFGKDTKYRFNPDTFPYTDPSLEMEVEVDGRWVEVLGAGLVRPVFLENLGVDSKVYNGWAFGFGLERLAIIGMALPDIRLLWSEDPRVKKQLKLGQKFVEVSKFPPITRDISFIVDKSFIPNDYFDVIRDFGGDLVEEVQLLDKYENAEKFGADKISYTYRIVYRSNDRTLISEEVDVIQKKIYDQTASQFKAQLR